MLRDSDRVRARWLLKRGNHALRSVDSGRPYSEQTIRSLLSSRQELDQDLERLQRAEEIIVSDPDIM